MWAWTPPQMMSFNYEERLNEIHIELDGLNEEALKLAALIQENYKQLM